MIYKGKYNDGFIWNPSIYECECNKWCDVGESLDYTNCKCRKRLIDKLGKECREVINGNENIYNVTLNDYKKVSRTKFPIKFIIQYT